MKSNLCFLAFLGVAFAQPGDKPDATPSVRQAVAAFVAPETVPAQRVEAAKKLKAAGPDSVRALVDKCEQTRKDYSETTSDIAYSAIVLTQETPVNEYYSVITRPNVRQMTQVLNYYGSIILACDEAGIPASASRSDLPPSYSGGRSAPPAIASEAELEARRKAEAELAARRKAEEELNRRRQLAEAALKTCTYKAFSACWDRASPAEPAYAPHHFPLERIVAVLRNEPGKTAAILNMWLKDENWFKVTGGARPELKVTPDDIETLAAIVQFHPEAFPPQEVASMTKLPATVYFFSRSDFAAATVGEVFRQNGLLRCESCPGYRSKGKSDAYVTGKEWSPWSHTANTSAIHNTMKPGDGVRYRPPPPRR